MTKLSSEIQIDAPSEKVWAVLADLEATSDRSRDLYAHYGFEVTGTIQVADSPPMFPMLRKAR